jgi:hypothetical protein
MASATPYIVGKRLADISSDSCSCGVGAHRMTAQTPPQYLVPWCELCHCPQWGIAKVGVGGVVAYREVSCGPCEAECKEILRINLCGDCLTKVVEQIRPIMPTLQP